MAEYRTIHTKFWQDEWVCELEPDAKLLFIYLVTNRAASLAGIYRLPTKFIAFETGITPARVARLLDEFQKAGKVFHEDGVIWVKRLRSYQTYNGKASEQVDKRISKDLAEIPDSKLKREYLAYYAQGDEPYIPSQGGIDTPTIPTPETETETETETNTPKSAAAKPAAAVNGSKTNAIKDRYVTLLGVEARDVVWAAGESAAAKFIGERWTPDQLAEIYTHFKNQIFWADRHLSLSYLKKEMPEFVNGHKLPPAPEPTGTVYQ